MRCASDRMGSGCKTARSALGGSILSATTSYVGSAGNISCKWLVVGQSPVGERLVEGAPPDQ